MKTRIDGRWVVGFDGTDHFLIEGGQVVFSGDRIEYVGNAYSGPVDRVIDARDHLVSPGLINYHAVANVDLQVLRIDNEPAGYLKSKEFFHDPKESYVLDEQRTRASARHSLLQMLKSGCTTLGAITTGATKRFEDPPYEPVILADTAGEMGLRGYFAHQFWARGAYYENNERVGVWDEARGWAGLERAVNFAREYQNRYDERVQTYLFPYTLDSCSEDLLRESARQAKQLGVTLRTHFAQSLGEVQRILQQTGRGPVEYLDDLGFLGPQTTLTHAIYIAGKDGTPHADGWELDLIAERGTSVCHCPVVFVRAGEFLSSFSRYRQHGINMAIGTDTFPQDMIEEMRMASYLGKIADGSRSVSPAADIFRAATLGGARAFNRDDLGRLAPGAKADIITIPFNRPHLVPVDDPIKGLINYAHGSDVDTVIVDGEVLVAGGVAVKEDEERILHEAQEAYDHMTSVLVSWDPNGRTRDEMYPFAFPRRVK